MKVKRMQRSALPSNLARLKIILQITSPSEVLGTGGTLNVNNRDACHFA